MLFLFSQLKKYSLMLINASLEQRLNCSVLSKVTCLHNFETDVQELPSAGETDMMESELLILQLSLFIV